MSRDNSDEECQDNTKNGSPSLRENDEVPASGTESFKMDTKDEESDTVDMDCKLVDIYNRFNFQPNEKPIRRVRFASLHVELLPALSNTTSVALTSPKTFPVPPLELEVS